MRSSPSKSEHERRFGGSTWIRRRGARVLPQDCSIAFAKSLLRRQFRRVSLTKPSRGGNFLKGFGLKESGHDQILLGGEEFDVTMFSEGQKTETPNEPAVPIPESVTVDGASRSVNRDESLPGREAPFFTVSRVDDEEDAYGYFCSQCGSTDVSADGQGRLECGDCGNSHLADEWGNAYL